MTAERWTLLKPDSPDDATKFLLTELLLEIVQAATNSILAALRKTSAVISEEQLQAKLGDKLSQSFLEALDISDQVSAERLTSLLAKDVGENISRLNEMIRYATRKLKAFTGKMKMLYKPRPRQQTSVQTASQRSNRWCWRMWTKVTADSHRMQLRRQEPQRTSHNKSHMWLKKLI